MKYNVITYEKYDRSENYSETTCLRDVEVDCETNIDPDFTEAEFQRFVAKRIAEMIKNKKYKLSDLERIYFDENWYSTEDDHIEVGFMVHAASVAEKMLCGEI